MSRSDVVISGLASRQHGLVTRTQLREAGVRADAVRYRIEAGRLFAATGEVLRVAGAPVTDQSLMMGAVLDAGPGAAVSHRTAAAVWQLPGFRIEPLEVTGLRGRARRSDPGGVFVHEPKRWSETHVVEVDHVRVITPSRVIFDIAGLPHVSEKRVERLLDTAWARNLVSHASMCAMLRDLAGRGRKGIALMRDLLADRPSDHRPPESSTEARFQELAVQSGLRSFERQRDVGDDVGWIGRVDFLDRRRGLVVEVGDALFHGSLTDRRADGERWRRLRACGLRVESFDGFDLYHRADEVITRLQALVRLPTQTPTTELVGFDGSGAFGVPPVRRGVGTGGI